MGNRIEYRPARGVSQVLGAVARKGVRVDASTAVELGVVDVYGLVIQDLRSLGKAQAG